MQSESRRRILIIDDQEDIHHDYRKIIGPIEGRDSSLAQVEAELFGDHTGDDVGPAYDIDSAFQGAEAVALVEKSIAEGRPYAVAFVDIRMPPGWDGIQTVRRIWDIDPEVLVVLCSAYSDYSWEDVVRELGRTDRFLILRKPFENVEVRQCAAALSERWILARSDALTGLLNRRSFSEQLLREWADAVQNAREVSCVMLDLDYFKSINDRYGHGFGDDALRLVGSRLRAHARPCDLVCRYGGEEFCIVMPNRTEREAVQWAEGLRQTIAGSPLRSMGGNVPVTASLGVAAKGESFSTSDDLVFRADAALRAAKEAGRNRVVCFTEHLSATSETGRGHGRSQLFGDLTAGEVMTTSLIRLHDEMAAREAAEILLTRQDTSLPVVSTSGELTGVLSLKDLVDAVVVGGSWDTHVSRLMVTRVIQYEASTPVQTIWDFLCRVQLRSVVIVSNRRPVGVVSREALWRLALTSTKDRGAILPAALPDLISRNSRPLGEANRPARNDARSCAVAKPAQDG